MSLTWKVLGACAAVAALLFVLDAAHVPEALGWRDARGLEAAPLAAEFAPSGAPRPEPLAEEAAHAPTRTAESEPDRSAEERTLLARARFVDGEGRALAGVEMRWVPAELVRAQSDAAGRVELGLPARPEDPGQFEFLCTAPGFVRRSLDALTAPGGVCEFGEVVLQPAGDILGLVRAPDGRPLAGARVGTTHLEPPRSSLDPARRLPGSILERDAVTADDRGRFRLSGVAVGFVVLCAESPGHLRSFSPAIEVRAHQESPGVELVLEPFDPALRVRGRVVDPEGQPIARADLSWTLSGAQGALRASGPGTTDTRGEFEFALAADETLDLTARDPEERLASASVAGLRPGATAVELRLGGARSLTLDVRDRAGRSVRAFRCWTEERGREDRFRRYFEQGRAEFEVGAASFRIVVEAEGFRAWQLDVADVSSLARELQVVLESLPTLCGRVRSGEQAVPGAELEVRRLATSRVMTNGFPSRLAAETLARGRSAGDGRFALTVREPGPVVLLVHHVDLATAELGPWDYDPERGLAEIDVQLDQGGAIEGRVLDEPAAGTLIGFSRGDGHAFTLRVGTDGRFRAERLTPGTWTVERVAEEIDPQSRSSVTDADAPFEALPSSCVVHAGQVTRFDLDDGQAGPGIAGRITLDGGAATGWSLQRVEPELERRGPERVQTDAQGRFTLHVPRRGRQLLALSALSGPLAGLHALAEVEVGGARTVWQLELASGTVEIVPPVPAEAPSAWKLSIELAPGAWAVSDFESGGATTRVLPAGRLRHVRVRAGLEFGLDVGAWPADAELVLRPGGVLRLELR